MPRLKPILTGLTTGLLAMLMSIVFVGCQTCHTCTPGFDLSWRSPCDSCGHNICQLECPRKRKGLFSKLKSSCNECRFEVCSTGCSKKRSRKLFGQSKKRNHCSNQYCNDCPQLAQPKRKLKSEADWWDEKNVVKAAEKSAGRAMNYLEKCTKKKFNGDYEDGFEQAFIDIALGGNGAVPPVPPEKYWAAYYRTDKGRQRACDWFEGYKTGSNMACNSGLHEMARIPTSLLCNADYSGCLPRAPSACSEYNAQCNSCLTGTCQTACAKSRCATGGCSTGQYGQQFATTLPVQTMPMHTFPAQTYPGQPMPEYVLPGSQAPMQNWPAPTHSHQPQASPNVTGSALAPDSGIQGHSIAPMHPSHESTTPTQPVIPEPPQPTLAPEPHNAPFPTPTLPEIDGKEATTQPVPTALNVPIQKTNWQFHSYR